MTLELPWPPSINHYWAPIWNARKRYVSMRLTERGKQYRQHAEWAVFKQRGRAAPLRGWVQCRIVLRPPDRRRRDIDNALKAVLDALTHAGVYEDDYQISRLVVDRGAPRAGGAVWVSVDRLCDDEEQTA